METYFLNLLGDDYRFKISYKNEIKELNKILDMILYLCNNVDYNRIKNLYINIIENYDYNDDEYSNFDNFDQINTNAKDSEKYIEENKLEIEKQIENFRTNYTIFKNYNKNNKITDYNDQNNNLINKLDNIISKLDNIISKLNILDDIDDKDDKDDIIFNIRLINNKSFLYDYYKQLKSGLLKNLHRIEDNESSTENEENEENKVLKEINEKLTHIYNTIFIEKLQELKTNLEELKTNLEELKTNLEVLV